MKNHKPNCICCICKAKRGETKGIVFSEEHKRKLKKARKNYVITEETRRKISNTLKGITPWIKGKHHTEESKKKMSISHLGKISGNRGKYLSDESKERIRKTNIGKKLSENTKNKISKKTKERWQNKEYKEKVLKAIFKGQGVKPTKPEILLNKLLQQLFPNQYKYVGDFQIIVGGKCPDFININGQKKIIELFGDYWHKPEEEQIRINLFAKYGYQTLIVWEHELKDMNRLKYKLQSFCRR